jgi:hypothetical protein
MNIVFEVIYNNGDNVELRKVNEIINVIKLIGSIWMGPVPESFIV